MVRYSLLATAAIVAVAITMGGCRREMPEPRGLGAADIAAQQSGEK